MKKVQILLSICLLKTIFGNNTTDEVKFDDDKKFGKCDIVLENTNGQFLNCSDRGEQIDKIILAIQDSPQAVIVDFSYNNIGSLPQIPKNNAISLKLSFNHCAIKTMENGAFRNSANIQLLDLSHNGLTGESLYLGFANKESITYTDDNTKSQVIGFVSLNLGYNQIKNLHRDTFVQATYLKNLNLEGNGLKFDSDTIVSLNAIVNLEELNLSNNQLIHIPVENSNFLTRLTILDISRNYLQDIPDAIKIALQLEELYISSNPIREFSDQSFNAMVQLRKFVANNMADLEEIRANAFSKCDALERVDISGIGNAVRIDKDAFGVKENLTDVFLNNMAITRLPENMLNWNILHSLELTDNKLVCDCELYKISTRLSENVRKNVSKEPICESTKKPIRIKSGLFTLYKKAVMKSYCPLADGKTNIPLKHVIIMVVMSTLVLMCMYAGIIYKWTKEVFELIIYKMDMRYISIINRGNPFE